MNLVAQRLATFYLSLPVERERALGQLEQVFTPDIHFRDPFRDTHGMADFRELFMRMFRQYRTIDFTGFQAQGDDGSFVLTYDMHLGMVVGPKFVTSIASLCQARDGRVHLLHDFYDFSSALASPLPLLTRIYRKTVNALFL